MEEGRIGGLGAGVKYFSGGRELKGADSVDDAGAHGIAGFRPIVSRYLQTSREGPNGTSLAAGSIGCVFTSRLGTAMGPRVTGETPIRLESPKAEDGIAGFYSVFTKGMIGSGRRFHGGD